MSEEFMPGDRVRVRMTRCGKHLRNFNGTVIKVLPSGKVQILEETKTAPVAYQPETVTKLKS